MKIIVIDDEGRAFEQAVNGILPAAYALHLAVSAIKGKAAEAVRMRNRRLSDSPSIALAEQDELPVSLKWVGPSALPSTRLGVKNRVVTRDETSRLGSSGR